MPSKFNKNVETKTYYLDELLEKNPNFKGIQLMTQVSNLEFVISDKQYSGFTEQNYPKSYAICLIEKPGQYEIIEQSDFINNELKIQLKTLEIGPRILKTYLKEKPTTLHENEFYFEGENWSELKEVVYGSH